MSVSTVLPLLLIRPNSPAPSVTSFNWFFFQLDRLVDVEKYQLYNDFMLDGIWMMHIVFTFIFIIACVSFTLCFLCYTYYAFKYHFFLRKHFPDVTNRWNRECFSFYNIEKYKHYMLGKGVTIETTTLKRYLKRLRWSVLLVMISLIVIIVFDNLR